MNHSVIIPTMWKSKKIIKMLSIYEKSPHIKEIIIIDNDTSASFNLVSSKIRHIRQSKNIYVNASWNLGASLANYDIIIANDDVVIDRLDELIIKISKTDYDIVGPDFKSTRKEGVINIKPIDKFSANSYGSFMFVRKYTHIPEYLKIWYGDNILFKNSKKRGIFSGIKMDMGVSETIKTDKKFSNLIEQDRRLFCEKYKKVPYIPRNKRK